MNPTDNRAAGCENPWLEIGIVADDKSPMAARVCIQHGQKFPLPSIQLGTLIGDDRRFSPFLHPAVDWTHGRGAIARDERLGTIPEGLLKQINELLRPHLVERRAEAINELVNYTLEESPAGHTVLTTMGCLSCS